MMLMMIMMIMMMIMMIMMTLFFHSIKIQPAGILTMNIITLDDSDSNPSPNSTSKGMITFGSHFEVFLMLMGIGGV